MPPDWHGQRPARALLPEYFLKEQKHVKKQPASAGFLSQLPISIGDLYGICLNLFDVLSEKSHQQSATKRKYGSLLTILYTEIFIPEEPLDLENGFFLIDDKAASLAIADIELTHRELSAVPQMATMLSASNLTN